MSQRSIDLLPESVRLSCQAGLRTGRYIAAVVAGIVTVVVLATHSRIALDRAQERFTEARRTADLVLQTEARAADLTEQLEQAERAIALHDQIAYPMRVSSLVATMVNLLPQSVSLDRLDLNASPRGLLRNSRNPSNSKSDEERTRALTGEMTGFAASDSDIIRLLESLGSLTPFENLTLDFTRTRTVRGQSAREFRISFRINLDSAYEQQFALAPSHAVSAVDLQTSLPTSGIDH